MVLLHWCSVSPQGQSRLVAIRFSESIRISSIRIFPSGARPFEHSPDIIASTEPDAFFLDAYFNAVFVNGKPNKDKQRPANALIPTAIAYSGGQLDFTVDMGIEYATRLMIIKGNFEKLSMAVYGEVVAEKPLVSSYEPQSFQEQEPFPLSSTVDPSNMADPTALARQLLSIIPDSPSLSLVIRLMFCMKPTDDDWDDPNFPHLYAELERDDEDFDLESMIQTASRPISEDTSYEILCDFATRIADFIGPKSHSQSYNIAKLLSITASQHPDMAHAFLQKIELSSIFDHQYLDEATILCLLDAAANIAIARHMREDSGFLDVLQDVQHNQRSDRHTQLAVRRLVSRIRGWESYEDAITNSVPRREFSECVELLKDVGAEEQSIGVWLESMTLHHDIVTKLQENPISSSSQSQLPSLFRDHFMSISHNDFIGFVRAFIGVASVLSVWAWADSLGNDTCRERSLALLSLWQSVHGYREILNHLLQLRQLTRRLKWIIMDNDPPRNSGVLAERIIFDLVQDPQAMLQDDIVKTVLALESPLTFIPEHERLSMRKVALVSEDGLPAAIEELIFTSDRPLSLRRLRTIRVSLAIVERELSTDPCGEWQILQELWVTNSHGFVSRLVEIFADISGDLNSHFAIQSSSLNHSLSEQLFQTASELMHLKMRLAPVFPLTSRKLRGLTAAIADLFACTEAADVTFSQSSMACMSAQKARQICLDLLRSLSTPTSYAEPGKLGAEIILRTLFEHATQSAARDPVNHLLQVAGLIDLVLPYSTTREEIGENSHWVTHVFPNILSELKSFFRVLDTENQVNLIRRLVILDDGVTGIAEWLFVEEFKFLSHSLDSLENPGTRKGQLLIYQHRVYLSVRCISDLIDAVSATSAWCIMSISGNPELSHLLDVCLRKLLDLNYSSSRITKLVRILAKNAGSFDSPTLLSIVLFVLRIAQLDPTSPFALDDITDIMQRLPSGTFEESLRVEISRTVKACSDHLASIPVEKIESLLFTLEFLLLQNNSKLNTLCGISHPSFIQLCDSLSILLPVEKGDTISNIRARLTVDEDEDFRDEVVELPETLELSIHDMEILLHPELPIPSTPKGTKTPDILGVVISPPTALLRSPAATGLTKTYANNDFRQLRQVPPAMLNTSRLPSTHVDDFENATPAPIPVADAISGLFNP